VGPRAGLDRCGKSRPHRDSIPGTVQPVAQSLYQVSYPAHCCYCGVDINTVLGPSSMHRLQQYFSFYIQNTLECFRIKYAGLHTVFPLFMQTVRNRPSLNIRMPSHASFLAPTTHNAGFTHAEYQCSVFCLTRTHESLLYTRIRKF